MSKFIVSSLLIIMGALFVANVSANYTEEDIKNMKMIFCGVCKDEAVRNDLMNYGKCAAKLFPEITGKVMAIRTAKKDDMDGCFTDVMALFTEFMKTNPDAAKKGEECFHANVKKEDLKNCH
ncbi:unnamed protein product [Medioppia subpectinata]|uniref:Uncharacterized protein n=1 Tax=Medioppia subpectinata TaxID=1979941 RepID=A0A7R9KEY8_9ACAR|nr:unnamed protein product [Medioppia subpectinata]CAG2102102.1 unnamed protein product [Medioppia subpectinata]